MFVEKRFGRTSGSGCRLLEHTHELNVCECYLIWRGFLLNVPLAVLCSTLGYTVLLWVSFLCQFYLFTNSKRTDRISGRWCDKNIITILENVLTAHDARCKNSHKMQVYQQKKKTCLVFFKKWIGLKWKIWIIVINTILKIQSTFLTSNQLLIMSVIAKSNWKLFF